MLFARKKSARFSSVVVPVWIQTEAPSRSVRTGDTQRLWHDEALSVIVVHAKEGELQVGIAAHGDGGVSVEQVTFA